MNKFKRIIGLMLAIALMLSVVPSAVLATEPTEYTGVELRVQSVAPGVTAGDAQVLLKAATDTNASLYAPNPSINFTGKWYHMYYTESEIPESEREAYAEYTYGVLEVFIKQMNNTDTFIENQAYLYIAQLQTANGATFAQNCEFYPGDNDAANVTSNTATIHVELVANKTVETVKPIDFTVSDVGEVEIKKPSEDLFYVYRAYDGSFNEEIYESPVKDPVGTASINVGEYSPVEETIDVMNNPQIVFVAVDKNEWQYNKTAAVLGYGVYTIPMSSPYIEVNDLGFNSDITVTEIGTMTGGKYHWDIAQASFDGWFTDKEGKTPVTVEQDAYAIFTLRSYSLFKNNIEATDFVLKCGDESYTGDYILPKTESNAYTVAFFIPSTRISLSLQTVGYGGFMFFVNNPNVDTISMSPLESGKYPREDIDIEVFPGYYVKTLKVNGEVWKDYRNPFTPNSCHRIPNDVNYLTGIPSFEPTGNTVISIEFAEADLITIDYGDNIPAYTGKKADENKWHSNAQYWAAETYDTQICSIYAFNDPTYTQMPFMLNTKPDGSGISLNQTNTHFVWESPEEYCNGKRDNVTLYVIMRCMKHDDSSVANGSWVYVDAKAPTCTEEGNVAYRYCPDCDMYETLDENGKYVFTPYSKLTLEKIPHEHNIYTDNGDGTHSVKCANCDDTVIESHDTTNGSCACGYREYLIGDVNEDGVVTDADAVYLLYHTLIPDVYPVSQPADFNGDGSVTDADAIHLLYHTLLPDIYPLN